MSPVLYDLSVPVYIRALENLIHVLEAGEKWAKENNVDVQTLADASIGHGMNPLIFQVQSSSNTAKAALTRLADMENVAMEDDEKTYPQLFERVKKTIDALKTLKPESMEGKEEAEVVIKIPNAELKFNCITYLQKFGLPNFFFHVTTAYNILRMKGVPIGKLDFLGSV